MTESETKKISISRRGKRGIGLRPHWALDIGGCDCEWCVHQRVSGPDPAPRVTELFSSMTELARVGFTHAKIQMAKHGRSYMLTAGPHAGRVAHLRRLAPDSFEPRIVYMINREAPDSPSSAAESSASESHE